MTYSLWQTQSVSVPVIYSLFLLQTVCVCQRPTMSVTDSLCLSQTVCVRHRQSVSVTDSRVCHRQSMSVTDNHCPSQAVCVCHRHSSWLFLALFSLIYTWFSPRFVYEIWICPAFKHHQHKLCGPLQVNCLEIIPISYNCWNLLIGTKSTHIKKESLFKPKKTPEYLSHSLFSRFCTVQWTEID